jgi:hypothetical protein
MAGKWADPITFVVGDVKHELYLIAERLTEKQKPEQ